MPPGLDYPYPDPLPNIGFIGAKRSGKDTAADYLVQVYGYTKLAFADPMRAMAEAINPIVGEDRDGYVSYATAVARLGYEEAKDRFPELRRFLQVLGTEGVRGVLGDDVWVDHLAGRVEYLWATEGPDAPVCVTDVRFPNEVEALQRRGFVIVRIDRPGFGGDDGHASETALAEFEPDLTLFNSGPIEAVYAGLETLIHGTVTIEAPA